eukprot:1897546-Amphidinium_carterae.1
MSCRDMRFAWFRSKKDLQPCHSDTRRNEPVLPISDEPAIAKLASASSLRSRWGVVDKDQVAHETMTPL